MRRLAGSVLAVVAIVGSSAVHAHFKLMAPASWLVENQLGDPQKAAPCGASDARPVTATGIIEKAVGGSSLHLSVLETVYHPGYYRVALSVKSRSELPPDPVAETMMTPRGERSVRGAVQGSPQPPILADGLWVHHERPSSMWDADITLPNINCEKCTLQIIQFMEDHGRNAEGDFSYHHCADLQIVADTSKPIDRRWPGQD